VCIDWLALSVENLAEDADDDFFTLGELIALPLRETPGWWGEAHCPYPNPHPTHTTNSIFGLAILSFWLRPFGPCSLGG